MRALMRFATTAGVAACAIFALVPGSWGQAPDSPLGSPAKLVGRFSTDYTQAVQDAMPRIDAAALQRLLRGAAAAAAAEKPLAIASIRELEMFFSLRQRASEKSTEVLDVGDAAYSFNPAESRIYLLRRHGPVPPVTRETFARELPAIRAAHEELVKKLGIPTQATFFVDFRETLSQTDGHPARQGGVQGPIQSEGATTTILRAVGGVLVDGSYLRISSIDGQRLERLDARWPRVKLAAIVAKNGVRAPRDATTSITRRISASSAGQPVNVRMAVVLRPVPEDKTVAFVPTLRVGVEPQAIAVKDGYRTDAGETLYVDLVRGSPDFSPANRRDVSQSRE